VSQASLGWVWAPLPLQPASRHHPCDHHAPQVLRGVMFNKDVVVPGRMRRRIVNPRVLLLDCPLEYKKGESQTNVELTKEEDWWVHGGFDTCRTPPASHVDSSS